MEMLHSDHNKISFVFNDSFAGFGNEEDQKDLED